jgi:hypothetical protein
MPKSCAIGVSRLTGSSTVIRQATQNATAKTADQLGRDASFVCPVGSWAGYILSWHHLKETCGKSRSLSSKV